jgi:anaerobic C4-dicarboxylate transporter
MKNPTSASRAIVAGALGAAVAGTATAGLSDNRMPHLSLLSMCLGAALSITGAFSLAQVKPEKEHAKDDKTARQVSTKERYAETTSVSAESSAATAK